MMQRAVGITIALSALGLSAAACSASSPHEVPGSAGAAGASAGSAGAAGSSSGSAGASAGSAGASAGSGGLAGSAAGGSAGSNSGGTAGASAGAGGSGGAMPRSDVLGQVTVGYQGWFTALGDGSPNNGWWHYDSRTSMPPAPSDIQIKAWPDMTDITTGFASAFAPLRNGKPSTLFSSYTPQTVDAHFSWMEKAGILTAALQRFNDQMPERNAASLNVMHSAEAHGRKFYVMYDISGWDSFQTDLKSDWTDVIKGQLHLTDSAAYAMQGDRPVVCIWGLGIIGHPGDPTAVQDIIDFFKAQGAYVIAGVSADWLPAGNGTKPGFGGVYDTLDMITPWMIGVIGDDAGSDSMRKSRNEPDVAYCKAHGIAYQPCVIPGDLSIPKQRQHGDFMWHQFANMIQIGAPALYVSMFDEFNEGNQIAKTAATSQEVPADSTFVGLDEDGTACSTDYYLRLTGDGAKMLSGEIPFTMTRPTPTL